MIQHPHLDSLRRGIVEKNDSLASKRLAWIKANPNYYHQMIDALRYIIEPGARVLHIRCSVGYLLNRLEPGYGVGIDDSLAQIEIARRDHPNLTFLHQNIEAFELPDPKTLFDYIIVSSVEDIVDLKAMLDRARAYAAPHTRLIVINYNYLWNPLVQLAEWTRLKIPQNLHNWISTPDLDRLCELADFEILTHRGLILFPFRFPFLAHLINRFIARLPFFRIFTMIRLTIARPAPVPAQKNHTVSIVIPCKDEAGNIEDAVTRIPALGLQTEIIFCDDKSTDGTADKVREMIKRFPQKNIRLLAGPGICKSENVWVGFDAAQGDILMILDADLTVLPEELPYFYEAIARGKGEFINGSRMVYPMHDDAMRFFNVIGNKFFSALFSFILEAPIKDTLCGTKVLWRRDYEKIKPLRGTWGIRDRWGDYELLFGAAKRHLKILDLPVHYVDRTYGETKMKNRFRNGMIMLRMCWAALRKIKFHWQ